MQITGIHPNSWKDLQNKVAQILERCGFNTEIEKTIKTARGEVEIDVYGEELIDGRKYSLLCECKFWGTNIPQTIIHGFRTIISDIGANIGYIITTSDYQSGAKKTIENTNVVLLTWESFQELFFESWYMNYFYTTLNNELVIDDSYHWVEWFDDLTNKDKNKYFQLRNELDELSEVKNFFPAPFIKNINSDYFKIPKLPLREYLSEKGFIYEIIEYSTDLPTGILDEVSYQELLEKLIFYGKKVIMDFNILKDKYTIEN